MGKYCSYLFIISQIVFLFSCAPFPLHSYGYAFYMQNPSSSESASEESSTPVSVAAASNSHDDTRTRGNTRWTIAARGGAFFPLTKRLTHVYDVAWPGVELEISCCLSNIRNRRTRWLLFGNGGWITKVGTAHHSTIVSDLNLAPFTLGLEFQTRLFGCLDFYLGAAPAYSLLRITNYNGITKSHLNHNAFGFMTKTGFRINLSRHFFLDLYGDYYYTRFEKLNNSILSLDNNFQGFIAGGGIGGKF